MKPELQEKLYNQYPDIFKESTESSEKTCMSWGLEIGDGWYNIIDNLCEALTYTFTTSVKVDEEDGKRLGIKPIAPINIEDDTGYYFKVTAPKVIATQVKEKFGTLRFYYRLEYDEKNVELVNTGKYPALQEINKRYADYIDGIVHFAEIASSNTCEVTGTKGQMYERGGWWKCLSPDVAKTKQYIGYKLT